jgi:hypothetical protein
MNLKAAAAMALLLLIFLGCTNIDVRQQKLDPNDIYFDYIAWGDEETGNITIKLQYRAGGPNQRAMLLQMPSSVMLDNQVLKPDSTKFTGPYYEFIIPASEFAGQHNIVFTDNKNRQYRTQFEFPVVKFKSEPDSFIARRDIVLELEGLKPEGHIRVLMTDTSFYGRGIEKIDSFDNKPLVITREDLRELKNGPVYLELFREEDKDLPETMNAGGRFYLSYSLNRSFILKDSL